MPEMVENPAFPDRVGVGDGPMVPCKVVEITATTAATGTVKERYDDGTMLLEQVQQYRIRYELPPDMGRTGPAPERIEASWMTARDEVRTAALDLIADQRPDGPARELTELIGDPGALFGRVPMVMVGQELSPVHAVVLDAYRRSRGLPPWLRRAPGSSYVSTAAEVNEAVDWWNAWQDGGAT